MCCIAMKLLLLIIFLDSEESIKVVRDPLVGNPIELKFRNPQSYTNNVLAMIIPRILNPYGKKCVTFIFLV